MATAAFIRFVFILLAIFVLGGSAILGFDWYASAVAEANARTRKRIEYQREHKVEDDPKELVKIYFGEATI